MATAAKKKKLFVRREIWGLERTNTWDAYSLAYAKAVKELQGRPFPADQTNYNYQAFIHGNDDQPGPGPDGVWNRCQHQSWFFFPWHRMYILWFERIVRAVVVAQHGPADWALPYWDWQVNRALPPAFRERKLPASAGGGDNPLFIADRVMVNSGTPMAAAVVSSAAADATVSFSGGAAGAFGFGGGVIGRPSHFGANRPGQLELQPHNNVHRTIDGTMGLAASPLDPIFWLHHAQIDRLWGRWLRLGGGRANPTDPKWLTQKFHFYKAAGAKVTQTPADVLSTTTLGYRYEDDPPPSMMPISALVPEQAEAALGAMERIAVTTPEPKELGVSQAVQLGAEATTTAIPLKEEPDANLELLAVPETAPTTVALILDDIEIDDPQTPTYEVYLNMPDVGEGGHHDSPHFVGFLEFFGVGHAHGEEGEDAEAAHGASRAFDITSLVHQLQQEGVWDPARVQVSFVPARVFEDAETGELLPAELKVTPSVHVGAVRIVAE